MREHLVNLLLEQFKLECWIEELENLGIQIDGNYCNNLDIILNIIGFAPDNSRDYDWGFENSDGEIRNPSKKIRDENLFCRDYLIDPYYELAKGLTEQKQIVVSKEGLLFKNTMNDNFTFELIGKYIDWLYNEYEEYQSGRG